MQIEKQQIAQAAASLVRPGMTVALDSGSTIWRIAVALRDKVPLVVVTASLPVIEELGGIDGITLICPGGQFRQANLDFVGPTTTETISKLRADIAFLGGDSLVAGRGLFAAEPESAAVVAALSRIADRRVATLDHSKFTQGGSFLGVGSSDLHCVITDSGLPKSTDNAFASEPYELRRAE
jgi:DeoR/GlpR family transcriptional regulator of sugar metabolism